MGKEETESVSTMIASSMRSAAGVREFKPAGYYTVRRAKLVVLLILRALFEQSQALVTAVGMVKTSREKQEQLVHGHFNSSSAYRGVAGGLMGASAGDHEKLYRGLESVPGDSDAARLRQQPAAVCGAQTGPAPWTDAPQPGREDFARRRIFRSPAPSKPGASPAQF